MIKRFLAFRRALLVVGVRAGGFGRVIRGSRGEWSSISRRLDAARVKLDSGTRVEDAKLLHAFQQPIGREVVEVQRLGNLLPQGRVDRQRKTEERCVW